MALTITEHKKKHKRNQSLCIDSFVLSCASLEAYFTFTQISKNTPPGQ